MLNLQHLKTEHKELLERYIPSESAQMCDFSFGNLFCWSIKEHTEFCEKNGFLYIRSTFNGVTSYAFPWGQGDATSALDEIVADAAEREADLSFFCVSESQLSILKSYFKYSLVFKEQRDYFDYVYISENLATLSGRKYHSKKNHVNSFLKKNEFTLEDINQNNIDECITFSHKWFMENESTQVLEAERQVIDLAFRKYNQLGFQGVVLKIKGQVAGFCFGEPLADGETFCVHFEKASSEFSNVYAALNKLFAEKLTDKYKYINREDDAGVEGLRKAKLSYRPEYLVKKYYAKVV
jgi:hypothetical protein